MFYVTLFLADLLVGVYYKNNNKVILVADFESSYFLKGKSIIRFKNNRDIVPKYKKVIECTIKEYPLGN